MSRLFSGWLQRDKVALALAGVFLVALVIEWSASGLFTTRSTEISPAPAFPPASNPVAAPPVKDFSVMAERPLFMDTRRPYIPLPSALQVIAEAVPPEPMTLLATVLAEGQQIAIIQSQRDNKTQKLAVGEAIAGWTLAEVGPGFVTLQRGNDVRRLDLTVKPGDPTPASLAPEEE